MMFENLELEWLGNSGFLIRGKILVYIDPFKLEKESPKADIILITHSHYDHCSIDDLRKIVKDNTIIVMPADCQSKFSTIKNKLKFIVLEHWQEAEIQGVKLKAVPAYNIGKNFHSREDYWNGYVIEIEGKKIYHAGDTDLIPEMQELENIDVALLPVSGIYTMNAEEAARAAILIRPKLVIPMHFNSIVGSKEDALKFMDACENEGISCRVLEKY